MKPEEEETKEGFLATGEYFQGSGGHWPWRPIPKWLREKNEHIHGLQTGNSILVIVVIILVILLLFAFFK
jgi:hypothetical protein